MITSLQNELVKKWVKLKDKKYRDETNTFLIEGNHLVKEAFQKGVVKEIITTDNLDPTNITQYKVTKEIMKKISSQTNPSSIMAVCEKLKEKEIKGNVLLLDNIQDPGNLGTIIRSAVAFNIPNLVLSSTSVDLYNSKVIQSTQGMLFSLNIVRKELKDVLNELKGTYEIIGTDVIKGTRVEDLVLKKEYCFIIGSEGQGMSKTSREYCEKFIYIPMNNACESLNAGVSASIIMYELEKVTPHE